MADLTVLIRLHKHALDEKRRALFALYAALAAQEKARHALEEEFAREKKAADDMRGVHFTFAEYVRAVQRTRAHIEKKEAALHKQIEAAKDSLLETFAELKKFEMAAAERARLEEEERRIKEGMAMDDIGLETFRRREDE